MSDTYGTRNKVLQHETAGLMGKGTLQDILSDERITLDEMFKSSMIGDAAKVS